MAKIWIKGFTRADGTKVKGHWREVTPLMAKVKKARETNEANWGVKPKQEGARAYYERSTKRLKNPQIRGTSYASKVQVKRVRQKQQAEQMAEALYRQALDKRRRG